jgi:outer membrane protein
MWLAILASKIEALMRTHLLWSAAVLVAGTATVGPAMAQDGKAAGTFLLRGRAIAVVPDESSTVTVIGGSVDASNTPAPELDLSYFFTDNIAVELIAATTRHSMKDKGSTLGTVDLGDVSVMPPTLTLQYHFLPKSAFSPYVGAGVNFTVFHNAKAPGAPVASISYENNFGWALQAGVDFNVSGRWFLNADVKKIFLNTTAKINGGAIVGDVDLDPWVFGVGLGYRF